MRNFIFYVVCLCSLNTYAQEVKTEFDGHKWEAPYHLMIPKNWTIERFLIPISFAPEIAYKGVEDIRFTPGWGNAKSADYWSYAFLWYLDGTPEINAPVIAANLKAYYTGLMKVNTDPSKFTSLPAPLKTVSTAFKATSKSKGDLSTYKGTVAMLDYMQLKPILLNCIAHVRYCSAEKKTMVFYQLSPQPFKHDVWIGLNGLWSNFRCKK
jgi:hypothetical protein